MMLIIEEEKSKFQIVDLSTKHMSLKSTMWTVYEVLFVYFKR
jgi:hypothetical protein